MEGVGEDEKAYNYICNLDKVNLGGPGWFNDVFKVQKGLDRIAPSRLILLQPQLRSSPSPPAPTPLTSLIALPLPTTHGAVVLVMMVMMVVVIRFLSRWTRIALGWIRCRSLWYPETSSSDIARYWTPRTTSLGL